MKRVGHRESGRAKRCPPCGKSVPVKAKDRERTVLTLSGPVVLRRNYHYCDRCKGGFYPVDRELGLPEEGELSPELEKRALDFAIMQELNDLIRYYRNYASRMHYRQFRESGLLIGSGVVESPHRHVLQVRMKRAGQHWDPQKAARMVRLRAAYRTNSDPFYEAIRSAHFPTRTHLLNLPATPHLRASNPANRASTGSCARLPRRRDRPEGRQGCGIPQERWRVVEALGECAPVPGPAPR